MDLELLGLGVPDSCFLAHASISEGSDAIFPTASSARPLKAGVSSPVLPLPLTAHHSLGDVSHTSDSNPHPCVSQTVFSLDFIPEPLLAHRAIQEPSLLSTSQTWHIRKGTVYSAFRLDTVLGPNLVCFYVGPSLHVPPQGSAFWPFSF